MDRYIKLEDAIRKYAEMIADEAYWEHGVGNGKPDEEDLDIAREYYSDLPTIEVSEDCISREWLLSKVYDMDNDNLVVDLKDIEDAPSVVPSRAEGEWVGYEIPSECSVCGHHWDEYVSGQELWHDGSVPNFCPNCGAKMKGADDDY